MQKFRLLILLCLTLLLNAQSTQSHGSYLALTHVTLIDATGAPARPDMTVILSGSRIVDIGNSAVLQPPNDAHVINAGGKFLVPGLWDMHVHWSETDYLPLFLANGVTGIRIMWGQAVHQEWRAQGSAGQLLVPHLVIASPIIDGPKPFWPGSVSVSTETQARQAVDEAKQHGADFIKVYTFLPREEYFAIADEAKKQSVPFAGHIPLSLSAEEASNAGQKSVEHLTGVLPACSTRSAELAEADHEDLADVIAGKEHALFGVHSRPMRQMRLETYSPQKAAALFALFKKNGTWQCPTLTVLHSIAYIDDPSFTSDPRMKYMPRWAQAMWSPSNAIDMYGKRTPEDLAFSKKEFRKELEIVGAMQKAGVGILAGTDTTNPFCFPGFSLHDELGLLVQAGLTPMQALQAATLNPARFLGTETDFGTIEKGKVADLVLLDANPLDDIANTKKISAVVYAGQLYARPALDRMLNGVEAVASRIPISEVMMSTIQERNVSAAVQQYRDLKSSQPGGYDFGENELIRLGYQLLSAKKITDAIAVFKLSTEIFPQSYNTWDSLAEAYGDNGERDLAIQCYKRSLELNPANANGKQKLQELESR